MKARAALVLGLDTWEQLVLLLSQRKSVISLLAVAGRCLSAVALYFLLLPIFQLTLNLRSSCFIILTW